MIYYFFSRYLDVRPELSYAVIKHLMHITTNTLSKESTSLVSVSFFGCLKEHNVLSSELVGQMKGGWLSIPLDCNVIHY